MSVSAFDKYFGDSVRELQIWQVWHKMERAIQRRIRLRTVKFSVTNCATFNYVWAENLGILWLTLESQLNYTMVTF